MARALDLQHGILPMRAAQARNAMFARHAAGFVRPHLDLEFAERGRRAADDDVAGFHRPDAVGRSGIDKIARIERVELGGEFDQPAAIVDQLAGIAVLPHLAVDCEAERHGVRVRHLVGGHHPRPEHRVAVDRFAKTSVLAAAHGHVETEAIAGDVVERLGLRNIAAGLADHHDQLDLVVVAPVRKTDRDAFRWADQRGIGFQEHSRFENFRRL